MAFSQRHRHLTIQTVLGDSLAVASFTYTEQLGRLFSGEVDLLSESADVDFDKLVGTPVTVGIEDSDGKTRYFSGIASRFVHTGWSGRYASYRLTMVPTMWLLSRTSDCRIFQNQTIPQILKTVLAQYGVAGEHMEFKLQADYTPWEYCVQYRETALNFVSRLMEHEGIYYYFTHTNGAHKLIIVDSLTAHKPCPGAETIYYEGSNKGGVKKGYVTDWIMQRELQPGTYELKDYDFLKPRLKLQGADADPGKHKHAKFEMFDYPGEFDHNGDGKRYARIRIQEHSCQETIARGNTTAIGLSTGGKFKFSDYPRKDQNIEYLTTGLTITAANDDFEGSDGGGHGEHYSCTLTAIPASNQFRTPRLTPKPIVQGPQTATVTGPAGQEIYVDDHARVKVKFHWDRHNPADETSSCWIRTSHPWAGKGYGGMAVPRIGQEVIVEFLEGDPDLPVINGRLYNAEQTGHASNAGRKTPKPGKFPQAAMMTSLKSNSLGGSGGHNEITMNDTGGAEGLYLRAQKDETHEVLNDREDTVGNNETRKVAVDRTREVGNNETVKVGVNRDKSIGVNETVKIGTDQTIDIGANQTISIGANQTTSVGANRTLTVTGMENYTVNGCRMHSVMVSENILNGVTRSIQTGLAHMEVVGLLNCVATGLARISVIGLSDTTLVIGGSQTIAIPAGSQITTCGTDHLVNASANAGIKAGGKIVISAPDITLVAGGSFIRLDGSGVTIQGTKIKMNSGGSPGSLGGDGAAAGAGGGGGGGGSATGPVGPDGVSGISLPGGGLISPETADMLKKIGEIVGKIPGVKLPDSLNNIIDGLANGQLPDMTKALDMIPANMLPPAAQKVLAGLKEANTQLNKATTPPATVPGGINPGGLKHIVDPNATPTPADDGVDEDTSANIAKNSDEVLDDYKKRGVKYIGGPGSDAAKSGTNSDCSNYVHHVMQQSGVNVPYKTTKNIGDGKDYSEVPSGSERPGDVIVQGGHMGVIKETNDSRGRPKGNQMGEHGPAAVPFGPNGSINPHEPVKIYRPKKR